MGDQTAMILTVVLLGTLIIWIDLRLLRDLARTDDRELNYFNRVVWALIIVISFPIGPFLYLMLAKGPRRF